MNVKMIFAVIMLSIGIWLFSHSQQLESDWETSNSSIISYFNELRIIHSSIERELLRLDSNQIKNFDNITGFIARQRIALDLLQKDAKELLGTQYNQLEKPLEAYRKSYELTIPLIDTFISHTAFLRNSLHYSSFLTEEILDGLTTLGDGQSKENLQALNARVMKYLLNRQTQDESDIKADIARFGTHFSTLNSPVVQSIQALAQHLRVVLDGKKETNASLVKILESFHPALLEESYKTYLDNRGPTLRASLIYEELSLMFFLGFVALVLHSIYKQMIKASQLSSEKEKLEDRVMESRESLQTANQILKDEIAQRIVVEEKLQDAAILYENCNEGVLICDEKKKVISTNPAYSDITGISEKGIIGKLPTIFDPIKIPASVLAEIDTTINSTGKWHGEVSTYNNDGSKSPKDVNIISLNKSGEIYRYIIIIEDISERKENENIIYRQANYDPLTKLPNRNLFNERANQTLSRAQRNKNKFAALFIDIDNFKRINDKLGHPTGDELLIKLASRLSGTVRDTDTVSRFGGDEFIILLDNIEQRHNLNIVIEKFVQSLSTPVTTATDTLHVTGSIGIAIYPDDGDDIPTLVRCADMAMYKAKERGKNTYCFFEDKMDIEVHEYLEIETELRSAIDNDELFLEYQPIVDPDTHAVYATEALLRWDSKSLGRIPPDKFIPIAEDSGLIVPIGEWILRTACQQLKAWNQQTNPAIKMSVNISTLQFKDSSFSDMLNQVIVDTNITPENLNIEITESLFLEDSDSQVFSILQDLRNRGLSISLDDFGTGYSSLSYLKHFPVNVLKIDRTFITDITENKGDQSLAKAIINMAKSLDIKVVAEGVETRQQSELLSSYHCDYIQGYLISKPLPANLLKLSEVEQPVALSS